ncbi:MAG: lipid-A-disaccharide synthase [Acidobacteria bacterium RIFCSPLOWO2_12_FULL_54_10]|nr:MAG: lipid-A-disaccharide synthase [Acidobacteria bacterium RIFCSPLOWO2_12_FULL_54_10]
MAKPLRIFVSAGEASGDLYGSLLINRMREQMGDVEVFGCGGNKMRAAGLQALVDANDLAMVGLLEVVPGLPRAWKALRRLKRSILARPPDLAVLIDFPDFNLRLAKTLRQAGTPVVYFVAPQVWAWRQGRLKTIRQNVDRLLCIFPFEEEFFRRAGVRAEFVGHPLTELVHPRLGKAEFFTRFELPQDRPLVALLPGSRRGEISLNLPPMLGAAQEILKQKPSYFVMPAANTAGKQWLEAQVRAAGLPLKVLENHAYESLAYSQAAVVASGTAAIEAALLRIPMVVVYRVSRPTYWLAKKLVRTPYYNMVNLVAGKPLVTEYIQDDFQPKNVAREILELLESKQARESLSEGLKEIGEKLQAHGVQQTEQEVQARGQGEPSAIQKRDGAIQRAVAIMESILEKPLAGQRKTVGSI